MSAHSEPLSSRVERVVRNSKILLEESERNGAKRKQEATTISLIAERARIKLRLAGLLR